MKVKTIQIRLHADSFKELNDHHYISEKINSQLALIKKCKKNSNTYYLPIYAWISAGTNYYINSEYVYIKYFQYYN